MRYVRNAALAALGFWVGACAGCGMSHLECSWQPAPVEREDTRACAVALAAEGYGAHSRCMHALGYYQECLEVKP